MGLSLKWNHWHPFEKMDAEAENGFVWFPLESVLVPSSFSSSSVSSLLASCTIEGLFFSVLSLKVCIWNLPPIWPACGPLNSPEWTFGLFGISALLLMFGEQESIDLVSNSFSERIWSIILSDSSSLISSSSSSYFFKPLSGEGEFIEKSKWFYGAKALMFTDIIGCVRCAEADELCA